MIFNLVNVWCQKHPNMASKKRFLGRLRQPFWKKAHQRMRNLKLQKVTKFGDPR